MDGYVAQIDRICDLADQYGALVMVDECHATGFIGRTGRGSVELRNALGRVDIITGTLGKALGGGQALSAIVGRREVMSQVAPLGPAMHSGTFIAHLLPVMAPITFLDIVTELKPNLRKLPYDEFVNMMCRPMVDSEQLPTHTVVTPWRSDSPRPGASSSSAS